MVVGVPVPYGFRFPNLPHIFISSWANHPSAPPFGWEHDTCPHGRASTSPTVNLSVHCFSYSLEMNS